MPEKKLRPANFGDRVGLSDTQNRQSHPEYSPFAPHHRTAVVPTVSSDYSRDGLGTDFVQPTPVTGVLNNSELKKALISRTPTARAGTSTQRVGESLHFGMRSPRRPAYRSGGVGHDSHARKSGTELAGTRTRFASVGVTSAPDMTTNITTRHRFPIHSTDRPTRLHSPLHTGASAVCSLAVTLHLAVMGFARVVICLTFSICVWFPSIVLTHITGKVITRVKIVGCGTKAWGRRGRSRILACGNRGKRCRWSTGFLGDLMYPPFSHSGAAPYSLRFTRISSRDLDWMGYTFTELKSKTLRPITKLATCSAELWCARRCEVDLPRGEATRVLNFPGFVYSIRPSQATLPGPGQRIFASVNRAIRCRWSADFLGDLTFPPPFHSGASPYSLQSPSSALKSRPNLFTSVFRF
ncbi:hypothetical protein PR048_029635, partial [Dryococelus australis]